MDDNGIREITENCKALKELDINNCEGVSETGIENIIKNLPNIHRGKNFGLFSPKIIKISKNLTKTPNLIIILVFINYTPGIDEKEY